MKVIIMSLFLFALWPLQAGAVPITLTLSDTVGAQTFLNKNVGYDWTFSFSDSPTFSTVRGQFSMKIASNTTQDATLAIYRVDSNTLLGTTSLAAASASSTAFASSNFDVLSNYTFSSGVTYRMRLTSTANPANETWYVREPNSLQATGSASISLASAPIVFDPSAPAPAPAPAPSSRVLLFIGLLLLIGSARKRLKGLSSEASVDNRR
jgi:hypothetical protein